MNPHIYDGGPAFPVNTQLDMTLRDYFAAKALETVVAYPQEDAMLRARDAKR